MRQELIDWVEKFKEVLTPKIIEDAYKLIDAIDQLILEHQSEAPNVMENEQTKEFCDCSIPYFPTGNHKWCYRCNKPTVY